MGESSVGGRPDIWPAWGEGNRDHRARGWLRRGGRLCGGPEGVLDSAGTTAGIQCPLRAELMLGAGGGMG